MTDRNVTLRHSSSSGRWCIEAPHPTAGIPQPHAIDGVVRTFSTLREAAAWLGDRGIVLVPNKKTRLRYLHRAGRYLTAESANG